MAEKVRLERPDIFKSFHFRFLANRFKAVLLKSSQDIADELTYQPNMAVIIRTRNDKIGLQRLITHINNKRQTYKGRIDIVVVDTESTDGTLQLAKKAGAKIVRMRQRDFNYPKSINLGLAELNPDVTAAFVTVGHAQPAVNICLKAGVRHFKDRQVVGVCGDQMPHENSTIWEQILYLMSLNIYTRLRAGAYKIPKAYQGIMQATNCMVRMETWREHKFDNAFGHGGEDMEWARQALDRGHVLVYEPAITVHHSHGLGLINFVKQLLYWGRISRQTGDFDQDKVHNYRPDLRDRKTE